MLDTLRIGMVRLNDREKNVGYMRSTKKNNEDAPIYSFFRIPIHVVFDGEGYDTYKKYLKKEDAEYKTWVHDIVIQMPPNAKDAKYYPKAGHEMFLGKIRDLAKKSPKFPVSLRQQIDRAIQKYVAAKEAAPPPPEFEDEYEEYVSPEVEIAGQQAIELYSCLMRSRFDAGRPDRKGEFRIMPFVRVKGDKGAKEIIETTTQLVCDYLLNNPKVSKFSESEGIGLKRKLGTLFLECFYKEQLHFMTQRLKTITYH